MSQGIYLSRALGVCRKATSGELQPLTGREALSIHWIQGKGYTLGPWAPVYGWHGRVAPPTDYIAPLNPPTTRDHAVRVPQTVGTKENTMSVVKKLVRAANHKSTYAYFHHEGFDWSKGVSGPRLEDSYQELGGADGIRDAYAYTHGGALYRRAVDMWLEMREDLRACEAEERALRKELARTSSTNS